MWKRSVLVGVVVLAAELLPAEEGPRRLTLVWLDHHRLAADFEGVRASADALLRELGVVARWEVGTDPQPSLEDEVRVHVVLMPSRPSTFRLSPGTMGVVLLPEERSRAEFVYVFYPSVVRALGLGGTSSLESVRERREIARALGRVTVHEVVHAVVPDLPHDEQSGGIMYESVTAHGLSKRHLRVDERTGTAFRIELGLGLERDPSPTTATLSTK